MRSEPTGPVTFYRSALPPLPAGRYTFSAHQEASANGSSGTYDAAQALARLNVEDAVLVDLEPAPYAQRAHVDVVILRAGKVVKRRAKRFRRHDAEVEAQAGA